MNPLRLTILVLLGIPVVAVANPPVASYIFPAGGQRGATVNVRVGGLFLYQKCGFEILGPWHQRTEIFDQHQDNVV